MSTSETWFQKIKKELGDTSPRCPNWVLDDFQTVLEQASIRAMLDKSFEETAVRGYMPVHGADHGLVVAYNALNLFKLIHLDIVESDFVKDFDFRKEYVLFALLVASYMHDVGFFYRADANHEEELQNARRILMELVKNRRILHGLSLEVATQILDSIKYLCLQIDNKENVSEKTEHALIKLADLLDCGKDRTYSENQKPELDVEYGEKMKRILRNDKHPERHFGFLSIDDVQLNWNKEENVFEIALVIKDYAASAEIKKILNILELNERGPEPVRELSRRIRLMVKDPETQYVLYPKNIVRTPGARVRSISYEIDLKIRQDDPVVCDAKVSSVFEIENVHDKAGISSHTFRMWGLKPAKWDDAEGVVVRVTDSEGKELAKKHERTEGEGTGHTWTTLFGKPIELNRIIKLIGEYSWKRFVSLRDDEFAQSIVTPTDRLEAKILFPEGITKESINAIFEIRTSEGKITLFRTPIGNNVFYDDKSQRSYIRISMDELKINHTYSVRWKIENIR